MKSPFSKSENKYPEGATKEVVLNSGKKVYFRDPKMSDHREAARLSKTADGTLDNNFFMEEFLKRLFVSLYRANGEKVENIVFDKLFDDNLYFTYQEAAELFLSADSIIGIPQKKTIIKNITR